MNPSLEYSPAALRLHLPLNPETSRKSQATTKVTKNIHSPLFQQLRKQCICTQPSKKAAYRKGQAAFGYAVTCRPTGFTS